MKMSSQRSYTPCNHTWPNTLASPATSSHPTHKCTVTKDKLAPTHPTHQCPCGADKKAD